jgi:hypothetical protein
LSLRKMALFVMVVCVAAGLFGLYILVIVVSESGSFSLDCISLQCLLIHILLQRCVTRLLSVVLSEWSSGYLYT